MLGEGFDCTTESWDLVVVTVLCVFSWRRDMTTPRRAGSVWIVTQFVLCVLSAGGGT